MALKFRVAIGQFRELTLEDLEFARQIGASGITLNRPSLESPHWRALLGKHVANTPDEFAPARRWEFMDLLQLRTLVEGYGLKLEAIENTPFYFYDKAALGLDGREEQIAHYQATIRNLAGAGIRTLGYVFSPTRVWRTSQYGEGRGGAKVSGFDLALAREAPLAFGRRIGPEEMWANWEYFIRAVLPVAEECGVILALHPDDPPVDELAGVARIFNGLEGFKRAMSFADSPFHRLDFCMGTWAERGVPEMFEAMEHFGRLGKLAYVHFRNVKGCVPKFSETFVDDGDIDVVRALRLLMEVGFDGFLIDDHVPHMTHDTAWGHRSRAFATGYIKGLCRALEAMA